MPTIYTRTNYVSVGKALPEDRYVATFIHGLEDKYLLTVQPIEQLAAAVRWAVEMADYMVGPISIMPIKSEDDYLRQLAVAIGFEGIHAQTDPDLQRQGRELLVKLGVPL